MASEPLWFGQLLREQRLRAGLTQEALAERAGLSVRGLSDLERGLRQNPHPETVRRLADGLGIDGEVRARFEAAARPAQGAHEVSAQSVGARPAAHNLPTQLTSFVGREAQRAEVARLLTSSRLVTLTGAGGSGKTRLALEVAASEAHEFADGAWLIELAPLVDGALLPQQVASVLGLIEVPGEPMTQTVVAALRTRHLLLILDNCEHLLEASRRLVAALLETCPRVHILATSRIVLSLAGETVRRVPSLSLPREQASMTVRSLG